MKAVILAGGFGTRLSEETILKPKPMVEIGEYPILWHIMKIYSSHGINEFVICCGYKGYMIKEYFANYLTHNSDVTFDLKNNNIEIHTSNAEDWKVTLVDTGKDSMTGGRLKRVSKFLEDDEIFCMTYGDGLSDVNISELLDFHKSHGRLASITAVQPSGRFGSLDLTDDIVKGFAEKPRGDGGWINGGFFVLSKKCLDLIKSDTTVWEREPMEALASRGELRAFFHRGFWQPMDTLREKELLEKLWIQEQAAWKVW